MTVSATSRASLRGSTTCTTLASTPSGSRRCIPRPGIDYGYDISDYTAIDPLYGSMADFDNLVAEAKKRNIRVIMDYVINHTSDQHKWFLESRSSRDNPKRDWYIWRDGKGETRDRQRRAAEQLAVVVWPLGVAMG